MTTHSSTPSYSSLTRHSDAKKLEVVNLFMTGLSMEHISEMSNVPVQTLYRWKASPWWSKAVVALNKQDKAAKVARISRLVDKSVETLGDRLINGDYVFDQRTGTEKRIPVSARIALDATTKLLDLQVKITDREEDKVEEIDTNNKLKELAKNFENFAKGKRITTPEVIDVEPTEIEGDDFAVHV